MYTLEYNDPMLDTVPLNKNGNQHEQIFVNLPLHYKNSFLDFFLVQRNHRRGIKAQMHLSICRHHLRICGTNEIFQQ